MSDTAIATINAAPPAAPAPRGAWHNPGGFGFRDILDIVNPLQHIPIVNSIYRWLTGDRPGEAAQIAGDALYGGPIGLGISVVSTFAEDSQGHNLGERVLAAVFGPNDKSTAIAAGAPPGGPATAPQAAAAPAAPASGQPLAAVTPDHPPMPLFGGMTLLPQSPPTQATAAHDFLAHTAAMERQLSAGPRPATAGAPVPLVLPAGAIALPRRAAPAAAVAALAPNAAAGAPVAAPAVSGAAIPPVPGAPLDISQKMMDALDKYMRLEQERKPGKDGAVSPGVDLSL